MRSRISRLDTVTSWLMKQNLFEITANVDQFELHIIYSMVPIRLFVIRLYNSCTHSNTNILCERFFSLPLLPTPNGSLRGWRGVMIRFSEFSLRNPCGRIRLLGFVSCMLLLMYLQVHWIGRIQLRGDVFKEGREHLHDWQEFAVRLQPDPGQSVHNDVCFANGIVRSTHSHCRQ